MAKLYTMSFKFDPFFFLSFSYRINFLFYTSFSPLAFKLCLFYIVVFYTIFCDYLNHNFYSATKDKQHASVNFVTSHTRDDYLPFWVCEFEPLFMNEVIAAKN